MDENLKVLILLNSLEGQGRKLWSALKRGQLSGDELWKCNAKLFAELGITDRAIVAIKTKIEDSWAEIEMEKCLKLDIRVIGIEDKNYPARLKDLKELDRLEEPALLGELKWVVVDDLPLQRAQSR